MHRNELAWLEGAQGGAPLWSAVPALIDVATAGNTLRVPTQLAQEKGIAEGEVRFRCGGLWMVAGAGPGRTILPCRQLTSNIPPALLQPGWSHLHCSGNHR